MDTLERIAVALERIADHLDSGVRTFDVKEAAKALKLSTDTVYTLAASGKLRSKRVGRRYRFTRADLERYLSGTYSMKILK